METLTKVLELAEEARNWAEQEQKQNPGIFAWDLCGMCARASAYLFKRLTEAKIPVKIAVTHKHSFVIYNNEIGLDITATQFGKDRIFVFPITHPPGQWWRDYRTCNSIQEATVFQEVTGWPEEQWANKIEDGT